MKRVVLIFLVFAFFSCQKEDNWVFLMDKGLPIKLLTLDSVTVSKNKSSVFEDYIIKIGEGQKALQVEVVNANPTLEMLKKQEALNHPFFKKMLTESEGGFIYELEVDGTSFYQFRKLVQKDDKTYIIKELQGKTFSKEEIEELYRIIE